MSQASPVLLPHSYVLCSLLAYVSLSASLAARRHHLAVIGWLPAALRCIYLMLHVMQPFHSLLHSCIELVSMLLAIHESMAFCNDSCHTVGVASYYPRDAVDTLISSTQMEQL